ncbi:hypothetical protein JW930_07755 [Candidatus Woesearchaeota archaeon]|nr:hypothetical protein [Candidatus Woesearchaeota archaeon]
MDLQKTGERIGTLCFIIVIMVFLLKLTFVHGDPEGAQVQYISNTTKNVTFPDNRTDDKGTITTIVISTTQQNNRWKAYVGNISGTLVLQDAQGYSIYQWASLADPNGQIYITRYDNITWGNIKCANVTDIQREENATNITSANSDSINSTFEIDDPKHDGFWVGSTSIGNSTCPSLVTYVDSASQTLSEDALFQEVLLSDGNYLVYTALLEHDADTYKDDADTTYDFQALVTDGGIPTVGPLTYYFYVELSAT